MSVIRNLLVAATTGSEPERSRALLLLDLAKVMAAGMADRMIVAPEAHGLTTSVADHAALQAVRAVVALEAAAQAVVARFDGPEPDEASD